MNSNPIISSTLTMAMENNQNGLSTVHISSDERLTSSKFILITRPTVVKSRQQIFKNCSTGSQEGLLPGNSNDLFLSLRSFFIFGKYFGLIPWQGLHQKDARELRIKKLSIAGGISLTICLFSAVATAISLLDIWRSHPKNALDFARTPTSMLYHSLGCFNLFFYLKNSSKFIEILQQWNQMKLYYTKRDRNLRLHVAAIVGLTMTSAILENITMDLKIFLPFVLPLKCMESDGGRVDSGEVNPLELYYQESHRNWANAVPYFPVLSVLLLVHNKLTLLAWNFVDMTLVVFARAIYLRFKILYKEASVDLDLDGGGGGLDPQIWRQLLKDHGVLCNMLDNVVKLLSPLVFVSYAANIYFIVLHVHSALSPREGETLVAVVYAKWSFIHLILRFTIVTLMSSKIHEWAHKSGELFARCPPEAYSIDVERADRCLRLRKIGFTGLGCFHVTRSLLLDIIGVVFSFEIVLLQASQVANPFIRTSD